jgi:hypothetical protein
MYVAGRKISLKLLMGVRVDLPRNQRSTYKDCRSSKAKMESAMNGGRSLEINCGMLTGCKYEVEEEEEIEQ